MQQNIIDGRYALGNLLGGGGMAQVYLAHDEVLGRDVALKILREQYTDEEFVERFKREAKNAAALNHPNIVQIYDQGQTEDGTYYIRHGVRAWRDAQESHNQGRTPGPR